MVRQADQPSVEAEVLIDAPVERVWPLVTDINLPALFSDEFQGATWDDGATGPAVGRHFTGRNKHPAVGEWETTSEIVACEPGRVLSWAVLGVGGPAATWTFELDAEGDRTRLRQRGQLGPGRSGLSIAIDARPDKEERIIVRRLEEWQRNMTGTITGIKQLAERGTIGITTSSEDQP